MYSAYSYSSSSKITKMGKFFLLSWLDSFKRGRGQIPFYPQVVYFQRLRKLLKVRHQSGRFGLQHAYSNGCTDIPRALPDCTGNLQHKKRGDDNNENPDS